MLECRDDAEQKPAAEKHTCRSSLIATMLEDAGLQVSDAEGKALEAVLWSTATPESSVVHLFLALNSVTSEQIAKSGRDRFFVLREALARKSVHHPGLVGYLAEHQFAARSSVQPSS